MSFRHRFGLLFSLVMLLIPAPIFAQEVEEDGSFFTIVVEFVTNLVARDSAELPQPETSPEETEPIEIDPAIVNIAIGTLAILGASFLLLQGTRQPRKRDPFGGR